MKKRIIHIAAIASALVAPCAANTVTTVTTFGSGLSSSAVSEGNNCFNVGDCGTGYNYPATPDAAWAVPPASLGIQWESATSNSGKSVPNGMVIGFFWFGALPTNSIIDSVTELVAWDDSGRQTFNGATIYDNTGAPQAANCASTAPTCTGFSAITFTPASAGFDAATDTFALIDYVSQDGGGPSGVAQWAQVTSHVPDAPEPGVFWLAGAGLVMVAWRRR